MKKYCVVTTTFADKRDAMAAIDVALERKLAACAQMFKIHSHYTWRGRLCRESEIMVVFKTTWKLYDELESKLKKLNPYKVPEIVAVDIEKAAESYLKWIDEETKQ